MPNGGNRESCEDLLISPPLEGGDITALQQQVVAVWLLANTSRCTWERFLQGLGRPLTTVKLDGIYDPVVFSQALYDAVFNEGVIEALRVHLGSGLPPSQRPADKPE